MKEIPRIAIYDRKELHEWPVKDAKTSTEKLLLDLHHRKLCCVCNSGMIFIEHLSKLRKLRKLLMTFSDYVMLCPKCGFWFGRGINLLADELGVIGRIRRVPLTSLNIPVPHLIRYINSHPDYLLKVNPYKAEEIVTRLLADALNCEVRHLGGRKDGGIDAYVVSNDEMKAIIQVKWHEDNRKAESVKVVRELAGTLLVKGVPNGILVTTRHDLSNPAKDEIAQIGSRSIEGLGRFDIGYKKYSDILSMLEISSRKISEEPTIPIVLEKDETIFDIEGLNDYCKFLARRMTKRI